MPQSDSAGSSLLKVEDATKWVRWWQTEGLPEVRSILWAQWDPLGLSGIDPTVPEDEYDADANVLASKLKRGDERTDIVEYLTTSLTEKGEAITATWVSRCEAAADALIGWYAQSNAPR